MNVRLANARTRNETGLDHVIQSIHLNTPFGIKLMKEAKPYFPGKEELLKEEYEKLAKVRAFAQKHPGERDGILQAFMEIKDIEFTLKRSGSNTLSVVEIFEIKSLLLKMSRILALTEGLTDEVPAEYMLEDVESLIRELDPRNDRMDTFYLYDEFSEALKALRKKKKGLEIDIRRGQKRQKEIIKSKYGIDLTPKFEYMVSKASGEHIKMIREIPELVQEYEDYISITFILKNTDEIDELLREADEIRGKIDDEELSVRESLSRKISEYEARLRENCKRIGLFDIALSKALYAISHDCVIPEIVNEHKVEIHEGRHLQLEALLSEKNKKYCPVSISLADGVTCITGANMGGKTISLKLAGLVAMLTQYAFFVPCKSASIGLSSYVQILIGDNQSLERGLSSFGSEMEVLKEILDNGKDRSLFLIDEIASGTNPAEGFALTKSLVDYLKNKPYISLMTTHFDGVADGGDVKNMQVVGLAGADFDRLDKELRYANRKGRIDIISKYMDYRLRQVTKGEEIPKDALNIAKMLGIDHEIIENAKKYLNDGGAGRPLQTKQAGWNE